MKLRPAVPIEHKTLLTLTEAQAVTGLSRSILRQAIEAGALKAKTIGKAWRVKRSDLDIYVVLTDEAARERTTTRAAARTSADDGHTIMWISALSWADAEERGRGRVTTEVAGEAGQLLLGIDGKSKNRGGSGRSSAWSRVRCAGVVAER